MKHSDLGVVVLAAGQGSRMGAVKPLLPWKKGTLLTHCLKNATHFSNDIIVVVGAYAEQIKASLNFPHPYKLVENKLWATGMGSSITVGVTELTKITTIKKILIVLVDQPLITINYLEQLIARYENDKSLVVSNYKGVPGVPAVFGEFYFGALQQLNSNNGAKGLLLEHKNLLTYLPESDLLIDLDTPEVYQQYHNVFGC